MTAQIIRFPSEPCGKSPRQSGDAAALPSDLNLVFELVDTEPHVVRSTAVKSTDTLADLHRTIAKLFSWDGLHNYFFSQGINRYEDPILFRERDPIIARCDRVYPADEVYVWAAFEQDAEPLHYVYNLGNCWEIKIRLGNADAAEKMA